MIHTTKLKCISSGSPSTSSDSHTTGAVTQANIAAKPVLPLYLLVALSVLSSRARPAWHVWHIHLVKVPPWRLLVALQRGFNL